MEKKHMHNQSNRVPWATRLAVAVVLACAAGPLPGAAQEVTLGDPVATRTEAFGLIGGVRELPDGAVLVADPLGGVFVRLDPTLGTAEKLGSEGEGPGEYAQPDAVWPIGRDRSILVDLGNARLSEVDGEGNIGDGTPIVLPGSGGGGPGSMLMVLPRGSDLSGHLYFAGSGFGPDGPRDSVELYRLDPKVGEPQKIATLKGPEITVGGGAGNVSIDRVPLGPIDTWGVARDGSVYIARVGDYSVEYVRANGSSRHGDPIEYRPVKIGMDEKLEWDEERSRNGGVMVDIAMGGDGQRRTQMSRSTGRRRDLAGLEFPDEMAAFAEARIRVDSDGNGWVRRNVKAGEPATYDVFNTLGERIKTVVFPSGRLLLEFGDGTLYAARTDEFDQQFLEKYELP
jgi:hypothetical protein